MNFRILGALLLPVLLAVRADAAPLRVVCSLATYCDIAASVGGEHVSTESVASPKFDAHRYEPRPSDVRHVQRAALFIHSGLDYEPWRMPLIDAAARSDLRPGNPAELGLADNLSLLEIPSSLSRSQGDIHAGGNPHYQLDPRKAVKMAETIAARLSILDPKNAAEYRSNTEKFRQDLHSVLAWESKFPGVELLAYHNEWLYLADFLGLRVKQTLEPKPGIAPTPSHLRFLQGYVAQHDVKGIISASYNPQSTLESFARRSELPVLRLCQHVGEAEHCKSYRTMMEHNIAELRRGLKDEH